jgi:hypothetical protein
LREPAPPAIFFVSSMAYKVAGALAMALIGVYGPRTGGVALEKISG